VVGNIFANTMQKTIIFRTEKKQCFLFFSFSSDEKYWFRFLYLSALETNGTFQRKIVVKIWGGLVVEGNLCTKWLITRRIV